MRSTFWIGEDAAFLDHAGQRKLLHTFFHLYLVSHEGTVWMINGNHRDLAMLAGRTLKRRQIASGP